MINTVVYYVPRTGEILSVSSVSSCSNIVTVQGCDHLITPLPFESTHSSFVDTSTNPPTVKPIPPKPSVNHEFDYSDKTWKLNLDIAAVSVRRERDNRLKSSDWTQLPDVAEPTRIKWQAYRQALRDVTGQAGFPLSVEWPEAPT